MSSLLTEHVVNEDNPHWRDFYCHYQQFIDIIEIRHNRKLAVLNIACQDKDAPYAFFVHGACARMAQFEGLIQNLSNKFNIIAFDRIGCGYSHKPKEYISYNDTNIFIDLCLLFSKCKLLNDDPDVLMSWSKKI